MTSRATSSRDARRVIARLLTVAVVAGCSEPQAVVTLPVVQVPPVAAPSVATPAPAALPASAASPDLVAAAPPADDPVEPPDPYANLQEVLEALASEPTWSPIAASSSPFSATAPAAGRTVGPRGTGRLGRIARGGEWAIACPSDAVRRTPIDLGAPPSSRRGPDAFWSDVDARLVIGHGNGEPIESWLAEGDGWVAVDTGRVELIEWRAGRRTDFGDIDVEHAAGRGGTWAYLAAGTLHVVDVGAWRETSIAIEGSVAGIEIDAHGQVLVHRSEPAYWGDELPGSRVEAACGTGSRSCIVRRSTAHLVDWTTGLLVRVDRRLERMGRAVLRDRDGALVRVSLDGEEEVAPVDCGAVVLAVSSADDTIVMRCGSREAGHLAVWHAGRLERYEDVPVAHVERSEEAVAIVAREPVSVDLHSGAVRRGISGRPIAVIGGHVLSSTMFAGRVAIAAVDGGPERNANGLFGSPRPFGRWVAFERNVVDLESGRVRSLPFEPSAITASGLAVAAGDEGPFRWTSLR